MDHKLTPKGRSFIEEAVVNMNLSDLRKFAYDCIEESLYQSVKECRIRAGDTVQLKFDDALSFLDLTLETPKHLAPTTHPLTQPP